MHLNQKYCSYDPVTKVWSGQKYTSIYNPDANLGSIILQKLIQLPEQVFQISDDTGVELTNFDIYERAIKFAEYFSKSIGLKQGDVVGLIASNSENLVPIMFACFTLGVAVNPLATVMDENDICHMWSKTKPKLVFTDAKIIGTVKSAVDKMQLDAKIYTMMEKVQGFPVAEEILELSLNIEDFEFPDLLDISATIALIMCSSGTTSDPKCICKSHKQIITQVFPYHEPNLKHQDIYFISTSSYWVSNCWYIITSALYDKKIVITTKPFNPDSWMDLIDRRKVTVLILSPRFGVLVLNSKNLRPLPSVRLMFVGGSVFSEKLIEDLKPIIPNGTIVGGYGCTEADAIVLTGRRGPKGSSAGYPSKNVKIKIVDENGVALGPNEIGEMCYKTPVPFSPYNNDDDFYKDAFDSDGFARSGDLGYIDNEGYLYILDRIKHMIKTVNAIKVTPNQIEQVINEIDGVVQSCVVGVFDHDVFYDKIYAFVIKDKSKVDLTEDFVMNYVNARVIDPKKITGSVVFVNEFPMTASGKVLNRKLKEIAEGIHTTSF